MAFVEQELRALWSAVLYFTRLPLPAPARYDPEDLRRASGWWPLTGLLVGGLVAGLASWLVHLLPVGLACALALLGGILLTGAMHEDGLADVCDGFGGGTSQARVLEIMKDSSVGVFGALGLVVSFCLRWQCLCALPAALLVPCLLATHAWTRATAVALMAFLDYARPEGASKARPLAHRMSLLRLGLALCLGLAPALLLPPLLWWALVVPPLVCACAGSWFRKRIGGYTGDCLGAAQQLGEMAMLLVLVSLLSP